MLSMSFLPFALALGVGSASVEADDRLSHGASVAQQFTIDTRGEGEFRVDRRRVRLNRIVVTFRDIKTRFFAPASPTPTATPPEQR